ncbi:hypothetical protein SmJEL517_g03180 [Synchytrium microbalum]|uniref:Glucose-methanol-choline oxidoreductase N-terminal domain-containing protein n=1 Tax=Synchytrium microbalum TaxID=1806994 RepID=A0A507C961_9FUNG|nr:uncharacterized protein SmJEL517_g03180 [Synchytrium microbalum]TPX34045.1 hypothetical protein SmJEL517_g03180 [Synchytrium microbalum]
MAFTDYIIVGGGAAGGVLAKRLAEDAEKSVVLLESGPVDDNPFIHIPVAFGKLFKTDLDYQYFTEPEPTSGNRAMFWPRAKVLGGCTSMNAMVYIRGNKGDYDRWAETTGDASLAYDADALKYFKKAEHNERASIRDPSMTKLHGVGGPLNVTDRVVNVISEALLQAAVQRGGAPFVTDLNTPEQEGIGYVQTTTKYGFRAGTARQYIRPALAACNNLKLVTNAHVTRLVFSGDSNPTVVGVEYMDKTSKTIKTIMAKETILCGGALNSPQLLMLSGIGPREQLEQHGIKVVVDLPAVGENMQDHLLCSVCHEASQPVSIALAETDAEESMRQLQLFGTGPLSSNIAEICAFYKIRTDKIGSGGDDLFDHSLAYPTMQTHSAGSFYLEHGFKNPQPPQNPHGMFLAPGVVRPTSVGKVVLASADPFENVKIIPNYFSTPEDINVMVNGIKLAREIYQQEAMKKYLGPEIAPGPSVQTDAQLEEYARSFSETIYHPTSTCKMGSSPSDSVVDTKSHRVHGVQGIRVCDASIMPDVITGNTNAPTIMLAERAADYIVKDDMITIEKVRKTHQFFA